MVALFRRHIPERFLRQLWQHQLFRADALETTDGERVEILSPGAVNRDSGPDFLDARIRIGGIIFTGNVELHRCGAEWIDHGHHLDPLYNAVILHVVFQREPRRATCRTKSRRSIPVLILEHYITASYHDLWKEMIASERSERLIALPCFPENAGVGKLALQEWFGKLAMERIELKMRRNEQRLRELLVEHRLGIAEPRPQYDEVPFRVNPEELPAPEPLLTQRDYALPEPWEQLLYEGIMTALGYSKNQEQMLKLARHVKIEYLFRIARDGDTEESIRRIEATLLKAAGLLSGPLTAHDKESRDLIRTYRTLATTTHPPYGIRILHFSEWKFFRLRPENFPTVRIAGAARLVVRFASSEFLKSIIQILKQEEVASRTRYDQLRTLLQVGADGFWATHYRLGERSTVPVRSLIGPSRAEEIILNTVIPIALLYARIFREGNLRRKVLALFEACPAGNPTSVTGMMQRQLLRETLPLERATVSQGCYQLYNAYCLEDRCAECAVGKEVFAQVAAARPPDAG